MISISLLRIYLFHKKYNLTEKCDHRSTMVSKKTVVPTNSNNWLLANLSYPASYYFMTKTHEFLMSIVHPNSDKTNIKAEYNFKNYQGWYEVKNKGKIFKIDIEYKAEKLFFSITFSRYHVNFGTYSVSLKVKDYLPPCQNINITIKSLFKFSF